MRIYIYKTKKVMRLRYRLALLAGFVVLALLLGKPILIGLARLLDMPGSNVACDAIVIEGGPAFSDYHIKQGLQAYYSGQAKKIILVLHTYDLQPALFGVRNYRAHVASAFDSLHIPQEDYLLLMLDVHDPYTYNSALALADTLAGFTSLLIFSDSFHIRRSYLTFKKVFAPKNVAVYPYTMTIYLNETNWWKSADGWRRVVDEYIKLAFYWFKGYI